MSKRQSGISEIGYWSEVKLDIVREYASAYSRILSTRKNPSFEHLYIDGFSGSGVHKAKDTGDLVWGSPTSVLLVSPPFSEYHFIDLDGGNIEVLREMVKSRSGGPYDPNTVHFYNGDCNDVLLSDVFPRIRYEDYRRGLCLLDPYGLHLDWKVVHAAGKMRTIELFVNFPIMDMNRNVLLKNPNNADPKQVERLNRYWGDSSWESVSYTREGNLFGFRRKTSNKEIVMAYRDRLKRIASFAHVPDPMPMKNSRGADVYYLLFASQNPVADHIVNNIFSKHRNRTA